MNKQKGQTPLVGASSLLVIFAVLCLVIFALLSLSTASAGERLAKQSAEAVVAYYKADTAAEEILSRLRGGDVPDLVETADGVYRYACRISDVLALEVSVRILANGEYEIIRWQTVSTEAWTPEDKLPIWDGEWT